MEHGKAKIRRNRTRFWIVLDIWLYIQTENTLKQDHSLANAIYLRKSRLRLHCTMLLLLLVLIPTIQATRPPLSSSSSNCVLSGKWTYLSPTAFDHKTHPSWKNEICVYDWIPYDSTSNKYTFKSPIGCLDDPWKQHPAQASFNSNQTVTLTFTLDSTPSTTRIVQGTVNNNCTFIDTQEGGLYSKVTTHPFFMPNHEWIRTTSAWLLRAAHVTFADGTRHLTPGYPTAYNGQWMRDSYYGISKMGNLGTIQDQISFVKSLGEYLRCLVCLLIGC